jgi:hypothetical protein
MSIAVNANKRSSPFGGAEGGCDLRVKRFPLLRTEKELLAVTIYKHGAPLERRTRRLLGSIDMSL